MKNYLLFVTYISSINKLKSHVLFTWKNFTWKKTSCFRKWWKGWRHPHPLPLSLWLCSYLKKVQSFQTILRQYQATGMWYCVLQNELQCSNNSTDRDLQRLSQERVWWRALPKKLRTRLTYFIAMFPFILAFSNFSFRNYGGELGFILKLITKSWYFL